MTGQNDALTAKPGICTKIPATKRLGICVLLNGLTVTIAVYFVVFFFFPHKIVFVGTGIAAATAIFWFILNSLSTYGKRILSVRDYYIKGILFYPCSALGISTFLFLAAALGTAVMFDTIVNRFNYLRALDRAIPFFEAGQIGVPAPADLAEAFALNPRRPEVPFILMRSSRLLTFDDRTENFYLYMKEFLKALEPKLDDVLKRSADFRPQYKLAQGEEAPELPLLDPIRLIAGYTVEVSQCDQKKAYDAAIDLLKKYRDREGDDAAKLQRTILEVERDLRVRPGPDQARQSEIAQAAIDSLDQQTDPSQRLKKDPSAARDMFRSMAFAADHVFQQALDYQAYLKAMQIVQLAPASDSCEQDSKKPDQAGKSEQVEAQDAPKLEQTDAEPKRIQDVVAIYQRILSIRTRLMSQTDVVWWQTPGKLTLNHMFSELSGKHGYGARYLKQFEKSPALFAALKKLHEAVAFKSFQDPETWTQGTPLSRSFNGSATAAQLRRWMQLGWDWKS